MKRPGFARHSSAKKVEHDGFTFDSKREHLRYCNLKLLAIAKQIVRLEVHPRIPIEIGGVPVKYPTGRQMVYVPDFRYFEIRQGRPHLVVEDVKMQSGYRTETYKLKRALLHTMGVEIRET